MAQTVADTHQPSLDLKEITSYLDLYLYKSNTVSFPAQTTTRAVVSGLTLCIMFTCKAVYWLLRDQAPRVTVRDGLYIFDLQIEDIYPLISKKDKNEGRESQVWEFFDLGKSLFTLSVKLWDGCAAYFGDVV